MISAEDLVLQRGGWIDTDCIAG